MIDETYLMDLSEMPGYLGPLFDDQPRVTPSRLRPFIWAFLLLRGAVRVAEVTGTVTGHICGDDIRIGCDAVDPDTSAVERMVTEQLGAFVAEGVLRPSRTDEGLYVISPLGLQRIVSIACSLDAQLPDHLLSDLYATPPNRSGAPERSDPPDANPDEGPIRRGLYRRGLGQRVRSALRQIRRLGLATAAAPLNRL